MNRYEQLIALINHANTPWAKRITAELQFTAEMSRIKNDVFASLLDKAIPFLYEAFDKDGVITNRAAQDCEAMLLPAAEAAKSYTVYCVGHAHIDMNWMWGFNETTAITLDTFRTVLQLMKEYPDFTFSQSQASTYRIVEQYDPVMFREIQQRVKEGRWEISSCSWVEGDKNLPSGESLVRQILCAKRYYQEHFGLESTDLPLDFEPDTFGHNISMPEILNKSGVKYYYHCRAYLDHDIYNWKAASGAQVLVLRAPDPYNGEIAPNTICKIPELCARNNIDFMLHVYGVGDHGGGPTRKDIEMLLDIATWPVAPVLKFSNYRTFFDALETVRDRFPTIEGELNYIFTGCYSSQARIKAANRLAEDTLYVSEAATALSASCTDTPAYAAQYRTAWEQVSFNQFHDILPGSGVRETREYALGEIQKVLACAYAGRARAFQELAAAIDTSAIAADPDAQSRSEGAGVGYHGYNDGDSIKNELVPVCHAERGGGNTRILHVFNTSQDVRTELLEITIWDYPGDWDRVEIVDAQGQPATFHIVQKSSYWAHTFTRLLVQVSVPAFGYTTYILREKEAAYRPFPMSSLEWRIEKYPDNVLENARLRAVFNEHMELVSLLDKRSGREMLNGPSAFFRLLHQNHLTGGQMHGNAWTESVEVDSVNLNETHPVLINDRGDNGGLRSFIRYLLHFGQSTLTVTVSLDKDADALRFDTTCNWREVFQDKQGIPVLKFVVPFGYAATEYVYKTALEFLRRPPLNHDVPTIGFAYAPNVQGNGLLLLSNALYAFRGEDNTMQATILRATQDPDPYPEDGHHTGTFLLALCADEEEEFRRRHTAFSIALPYFTNTRHSGTLPLEQHFMQVSGPLMITALKTREDGRPGLVLRAVNHSAQPTEGVITFPHTLKAAAATDILEQPLSASAAVLGDAHTVRCTLAPQELLTLCVEFEQA